MTVVELARKVLETVDRAAGRTRGTSDGSAADGDRLVFVPYEQAYQVGFEDMRRRVPDISKIDAAIGWGPVITLEQTLARVVETLSGSLSASPRSSG